MARGGKFGRLCAGNGILSLGLDLRNGHAVALLAKRMPLDDAGASALRAAPLLALADHRGHAPIMNVNLLLGEPHFFKFLISKCSLE